MSVSLPAYCRSLNSSPSFAVSCFGQSQVVSAMNHNGEFPLSKRPPSSAGNRIQHQDMPNDPGRKRERLRESAMLLTVGDGKRQRLHEARPMHEPKHMHEARPAWNARGMRRQNQGDADMKGEGTFREQPNDQASLKIEMAEDYLNRRGNTAVPNYRERLGKWKPHKLLSPPRSLFPPRISLCVSDRPELQGELIDIFTSPHEGHPKKLFSPSALSEGIELKSPGESASPLALSVENRASSMPSESASIRRSPKRSLSAGGLLSRSTSTRPGTATKAGFRNVGNSCYMSCILAALYSVPELVERMKLFGHAMHRIIILRQLLENSGSKTYVWRSTEGSEYRIPGCGLFNAIVALAIDFTHEAPQASDNGGSSRIRASIDIGLFKSLVSDQCPYFAGFEQHDAHEFLIVILDAMEEQLIHQLKELMKHDVTKKRRKKEKEIDEAQTPSFGATEDEELQKMKTVSSGALKNELVKLETLVGLRESTEVSTLQHHEGFSYSEDSKRCDGSSPFRLDKLSVAEASLLLASPSSSASQGTKSGRSSRRHSQRSLPGIVTSITHEQQPQAASPTHSSTWDPSSFPSQTVNPPTAFRTNATDDALKVLVPTYQMTSGSVANLLRCQSCGYERACPEPFRVVTLSIPTAHQAGSTSTQLHSELELASHLEPLSLAAPSTKTTDYSDAPPICLEELLDYYTRPNVLDCRCSQEECKSTKVETTYCFNRCPKIILLHINRIIPKCLTDSALIKIRRRVDISLNVNFLPYTIKSKSHSSACCRRGCTRYHESNSMEDLDGIRVVITADETDELDSVSPVSLRYTLKAIISHIGQRAQSGHFVCYVRDQRRGGDTTMFDSRDETMCGEFANKIRSDTSSMWYCHNDSDVRVVTSLVVERAVQRDGYIIVYEKIQ